MQSDTQHSTTDRGFELVTWLDHYGERCELQQSSLVHYDQPGTSCIWLGVPDNRMHLTVGRALWLSRQLSHWAQTGFFSEQIECGEDFPDAE